MTNSCLVARTFITCKCTAVNLGDVIAGAAREVPRVLNSWPVPGIPGIVSASLSIAAAPFSMEDNAETIENGGGTINYGAESMGKAVGSKILDTEETLCRFSC